MFSLFAPKKWEEEEQSTILSLLWRQRPSEATWLSGSEFCVLIWGWGRCFLSVYFSPLS